MARTMLQTHLESHPDCVYMGGLGYNQDRLGRLHATVESRRASAHDRRAYTAAIERSSHRPRLYRRWSTCPGRKVTSRVSQLDTDSRCFTYVVQNPRELVSQVLAFETNLYVLTAIDNVALTGLGNREPQGAPCIPVPKFRPLHAKHAEIQLIGVTS